MEMRLGRDSLGRYIKGHNGAKKTYHKMNKTILITGISGFIPHHLCEHILKTTDYDIVGIDKLGYASSGFDRLRDIGAYNNKRVRLFTHDLSQPITNDMEKEIGKVDYICHLAAETHVDRSIKEPEPFVLSNVIGTMRILDFATHLPELKKFLYFSTDEVFGDAPKGVSYKEWDRYNSRNPYAASKAGGEELALAYSNTYGVPVIITHTMNCFGERQHNEKFIPIIINKLRTGKPLEIHCTDGVPASRSWIHARNASSAIMFLLENTPGIIRDKINITGEKELNNLELARLIADIMGKELNAKLVNYYADRPGHDPRYMLDGTRLRELGWKMPVDFYDSLSKTISWSLEHERWLDWEK